MDSFRFCVAPMWGWTDRHCRFFHRLLTKKSVLYTEMVSAEALLRLPSAMFMATEGPVALQVGGGVPETLSRCARLAQAYGYQEINLNVGCPSPRVQRGGFGALLFHRPAQVAACLYAMREATDLPVTIKTRIGVDQTQEADLHRFVETVVQGSGCTHWIFHARRALLSGLNPAQNRCVPPLEWEVVFRLKRAFPQLTVILNGGLSDPAFVEGVDGVMMGRAAYHHPERLAEVDQKIFGLAGAQWSGVVDQLVAYGGALVAQGQPLRGLTRHLVGLFRGCDGARAARCTLLESNLEAVCVLLQRWVENKRCIL